jgi:lipid II:glycine glycyltransferase (peptidoglycan interpeptide bridge formation enzyme)
MNNELHKFQQLAAEKNKFNNQKKRIEKMQAELEKNSDAIQLVQIDLVGVCCSMPFFCYQRTKNYRFT